MEETVAMLKEIGFSEEHSKEALRAVGHLDVQSAVDWMLAHPPKPEKGRKTSVEESSVEETSLSAFVSPSLETPAVPPPPPPPPLFFGIPEPPPQPPVEPFKLQEGFIPPPPPPAPELLVLNADGTVGPAVSNEFLDKIAQTASVRGTTSTFHPKGASGRVGLQNQGATCYLNSLLQTLYLEPSFRSVVYSFRYDEKKDGDKASCIPFQLQLLFAELQIGENGVAKTAPLTDAFGWKDGQQYQQHDVQELMRVLLNALETSFKEKESDPDAVVTPLFTGILEDYLECLVCHHKKSRSDPYSDLQLFVEKADSISQAFANFVMPETLNGGNQVHCDKCNSKADANKGLRITTVPQVLTLQLKRFTYDPVTWQRVKLSKRVTYPLYLNTVPLLNTSVISEDALIGQDERPVIGEGDKNWYELFSVLIHSGGALGGHYYAYCRDVVKGVWYNFNDMDVRAIAEKDALAMCGAVDGQTNVVSSTNAYMLLYRKMSADESFEGCRDDRIPDYIKALIETANDEIKDKKVEYEQAMRFVTVNVYVSPQAEPVAVQLERKMVYHDAGRAVAQQLKLPLEGRDYRLMGFIPKRGKMSTESFVGRESDTLQGLGFHTNKNVLLQHKAENESWPLEIPSFQLEIVLANQGRERFEPARYIAVRADARVRQLMNLIHDVYAANGIFRDRNDIALVRIAGESYEHTSRVANWNKTLNELGIVDGCRVYAESRMAKRDEPGWLESVDWDHLVAADEALLPNLDLIYAAVDSSGGLVDSKEEDNVSEFNSFVVAQFEVQRNTIEISYNIPEEGADVNKHVVMDQMIEIDQRRPLKDLRKRLAQALNLGEKSFIIRKNLDKKEYREDEMSLADLKIYTGNALLLQLGTPLTADFCKIRMFYLDSSKDDEPLYVGEMPIKKAITLREMKEQVGQALGEKCKYPYFRISEKIGTKLSRTVLGDALTVEKAIPHLRDNFELCIESIPEPDNMSDDDFVLHVKRWNAGGSGLVQSGVDQLIVSRSATIHQIKSMIANRFNVPLERVMLSKPFRSLLAQLSTVLEAVQSVHWDVDPESVGSKSPWYLSNGELVMWKDSSDPEKHVEFLESIYGAGTATAHAPKPEPQLKIMSKFDRQHEAATKSVSDTETKL